MNPRVSPGPKFRRRAAGYYTLRFAGLFDYEIFIHFVLKILVSRIKHDAKH